MGRPWWHDNYWEKDRKPQRSPRLPRRKGLVWTGLIVLSLLLAMSRTGFQPFIIVILDDVTEPILAPLRRIVPMLGVFDITPLIAIGILYAIPIIIILLAG